MPADAEDSRRYRQRLKERVRVLLGDKCDTCGGTPIEFAHVKPTGLNGMGRGLTHRLLDVIKHPKHYRAMCRKCHLEFDRKRREKEIKKFGDEVPF